MRGYFSRMNSTLRGFLIIVAIAAVIVALRLEATLVALLLIARIAFLLAIAFFIFLMWRAVADLGVNWYGGAHGLQVLAFVGVLALSGVAMWRTWRDQHRYV